eukprot:3132874-Pyramimonas_sp.AAC.2
MVSDYQWFPIAPASSQEYNLDTRVGGPTVTFLDVIHWGAIDEKEHELRLTVDAGINGLRVVAGTIKIRSEPTNHGALVKATVHSEQTTPTTLRKQAGLKA